MNFYLAPMEGITGYVYRNALKEQFGDKIEKYYAPFIVPRPKKGMQSGERTDLLPENNKGIFLVPQILTRNAEDFISLAERIQHEFGYQEINLNLGCPSKTVVSGGRGAGFLDKTEELNHFLETVFSRTTATISIKTRLGMDDPEEFVRILEIYNQYPLSELIIHARVQSDYYKKDVHMAEFCEAMRNSKAPVCYNGDIFTPQEYEKRMRLIGESGQNPDDLRAVMLGRGLIGNPALIREICGGEPVGMKELNQFLERILEGYHQALSGDVTVLYRMKELWSYLITRFPEKEKQWKAIQKSRHITEYKAAVREIFRQPETI